MVQIAFANIEDAEEIYALLKDVGRSAYTLDLVKDLITTEGSYSLVLTEEKYVVGALGARAEGKDSSWLYYIVIHTDFRGKGYARELIKKLFEELKSAGIKRVALDTPDKEFFSKFHFREAGRIPNWYVDKDQFIMYYELS